MQKLKIKMKNDEVFILSNSRELESMKNCKHSIFQNPEN